MSKGLIPPIQLYPTDDGELQVEVEHEVDPDHFAHVTLTRNQVKHLIAILTEWYDAQDKDIVF